MRKNFDILFLISIYFDYSNQINFAAKYQLEL